MSAPVLVTRIEGEISVRADSPLIEIARALFGRSMPLPPAAAPPASGDGGPEEVERLTTLPLPSGPDVEARDAAAAAAEALSLVWSADRDALLQQNYPQGIDAGTLLDAVNSLAGPPVKSVAALRRRVVVLGLTRLPGKIVTDAPRTSAKWTPERNAVIAADVPAMVEWAVILDRVNALPGTPVESVAAVQQRAKYLGARRDPERVRAGNAARMAAYQAGLRAQREALAAQPGDDAPAAPVQKGDPAPEPGEPEPIVEAEAEALPAPQPEPGTPLPPAPDPAPEPAPPLAPAPEPAPPELPPAPASEPEPPSAPGEIVPDRPEFTCLGKPLTRPQVVDNAERLGLRFTGDLTALNRKRAHAGYPPIEALVPNRPVQRWKK